MQSHYELFCVMLGRLEVVKVVISAKLASDFISLHCNCFTYDGPDTMTPLQRKCPLSQSCQFYFGSLWLCDPALHSSHQTQRYYNEYLAAKNIPSSQYGTKNMEMPHVCLRGKMLLPVSPRLVKNWPSPFWTALNHYCPFISLDSHEGNLGMTHR